MAHASVVTRHARLTEEFGLAYATRLFGEEAVASLPRFVRGKHAGLPKGYLHWVMAERGGWSREAGGAVVRPGELVRAWIGEGPFSQQAMYGQWLGRNQELSGAAYYLGEAGRARDASDKARDRADYEASLAAAAVREEDAS